MSCQIAEANIISNENISHIYQVPLLFRSQFVADKILKKLGLPLTICKMEKWRQLNKHFNIISHQPIQIEIIGKYTGLQDSYLSLIRSLEYASFECQKYIKINFTDAESINWSRIKNAHGIIVAGGFGERGTEGKIECCTYARENKIPLLGICLGMQLIAIEFARNILDLKEAHSTEFDRETPHPVVCDMPLYNTETKGGTMRLGNKNIQIDKEKSFLYDTDKIVERHRHRYEINPKYYSDLEEGGLYITGKGMHGGFAEILEYELMRHPFYVGCQFHPEYNFPNPIFRKFLEKTILK